MLSGSIKSIGIPLSSIITAWHGRWINSMLFTFPLYVFSSLVFLDYLIFRSDYLLFRKPLIRGGAFISLLLALLMLASKLFIVLSLLFMVYVVWRENRRNSGREMAVRTGTLGVALLLGGVLCLGFARERFSELFDSQFEVVHQEQFSWDTPFNGLTLRLVLFRFGLEILDRPAVWLTGVGAGDAQNEINTLIRKYNLYHGNPSLGDKGYLDYNVHNQFLETWIQIGIVGLLCWSLILGQGWLTAVRRRMGGPFFFVVSALILYAVIESVIERQRGIVFLTYFFSLFYLIPEHEHS